jgi:hypothetical protein
MMHLTALPARVSRKPLKQRLFCGAILLWFGIFPAAKAQGQGPAAAISIGQVVGDEISVIGPSNAVTTGSVQAIAFGSGSTVVVHSGKARVQFDGGGQMDVCGPAKFTVLASDQALTIALSFGRVHVRFDAVRPIVIYTPAVIATPLSAGERPRDATVGLTNRGAMCVLASVGAVRLQNQLTGEAIVVPEPMEVQVQGGSFENLPAAVGQCRCDFDEPIARPPAPPVVQTPPSQTAAVQPEKNIAPAPSQPPKQTPAVSPAPRAVAAPQQTAVSQPPPGPKPQTASNKPPTQPVQVSSSAQPPAAMTDSSPKINLPIGYDAKGAPEAAEPLSVATLLLAQQAVVQPEWIFHGTVVAPVKQQHSAKPPITPQSASSPPAQTSTTPAPQPKKGFWARFRSFLTGSH